MAYWIGALAPLAAMARRRNDDLPRVLKQFSAMAVPLVGLLVLSGLVLSIIQLGSVRALIETQYGIILSIKLALVILLLGLAALNRFLFTPAVVANYENTRPLLGSILLECVLVVGILAVVAGWRFTPPPRASVAPVAAPLSVHIHTDAAMFQVLVSPGKVGANDFVLQLMTGDAAPAAGQGGDADPELAGARHRADGASRDARAGRLLARARRRAAAARPLADADRRAGHGFPEDHAAR